jgi:hypothetical protein
VPIFAIKPLLSSLRINAFLHFAKSPAWMPRFQLTLDKTYLLEASGTILMAIACMIMRRSTYFGDLVLLRKRRGCTLGVTPSPSQPTNGPSKKVVPLPDTKQTSGRRFRLENRRWDGGGTVCISDNLERYMTSYIVL